MKELAVLKRPLRASGSQGQMLVFNDDGVVGNLI